MAAISYEKLLVEVTGNGQHQAAMLFFALLTFLPAAFMNTGSVFLSGLPKSRCALDFLINSTNEDENLVRKTFIPWNTVTKDYDRCRMFSYNLSQCENNRTLSCAIAVADSLTEPPAKVKCDGYYFLPEPYEETVATEWDLVCDRLTIKSFSTSAYFFGLLVGAFAGGALSDRFGRVLVIKLGATLTVLSGIAVSFSPNIYVFSFLRFLLAFFNMAMSVSAVVYASEIVQQSWRVCMGTVGNLIFGAGCIVMAGMAYQWREWRTLEVVLSIGTVPCLISAFFMPKSPRWLFSQQRMEEAKSVLTIMALRNGAKFNDEVLDRSANLSKDLALDDQKDAAIREMLRRPNTRYILLCCCFVWAINSMVFYGLALNSGGLGGNVYINHSIGGIVEIVACSLCIPGIKKFGRKPLTVASLAISSLSCLVSTLFIHLSHGNVALQTTALVFVMVGRFTSSATFALNYQQTVELFPTPGRGTGLGVSSMSARIGSIFSPFTLQLQYEVPWLTQTIFGVACLFAAILASTYPETKGMPLLSTFDEAEEFFAEHLDGSLASKICCLPTSRKNDNEKERLSVGV